LAPQPPAPATVRQSSPNTGPTPNL
jgi:hypothetical protein